MGHPWAASRPACLHGHPWPQHLAHNNRGHAYCTECRRIRNLARWREHHPPAIHDPVAVDRAVAGDPPERLASSERTAAIKALTERGVSARQIAERIGCSQRTVHRARNRTTAAA